MDRELLKEKLEWAIMGWAAWDAIGLPVEMKTKEYIKAEFWYIDRFHETRKNIFFAKWWFDEEGVWYISDDTLLTLATLDSLSESWKLDFDSVWRYHLKYYDTFPYWFWKSTKNALEAIRSGASYLETWSPSWTGNGIMMKQAPLAFYYAISDISEEQMNKEIRTYSCMTHANKITVVSAIVHNMLLMELIRSDWDIGKKELFWKLLECALKYESEITDLESDWENISDRIREICELIDGDGVFSLSDEMILEKFWWWEEKIYKSCYIAVTLPIVYSIFLRNPDLRWFFGSINIWGDTDSYWAIMWNMVGAYRGGFLHDKFLWQLQDFDTLKERIAVFAQKFIN
ncbi:MAG: hypothetical protein ACD_3C00182G0005 [uncultured bacterium (gcode 4)]|uniref:ADP-ribosylglycohydrolase n=1 Tax=uncultured bacterium (gcode 4) TaxID=1234023 RepID=K2GBV3_9BACT|nr:MAG: hypothetical protein ACD_3C00182G0005 [uncultured bacterium (gcode 4)]